MRILIAGDYCPHARVEIEIEKDRGKDVFDGVRQLTGTVDYSILNFECPITLNSYEPIKKVGPHLRTTIKSLKVIKEMGFNMVTLANNHILDFGENGVRDTINSCIDEGIEFVGAGQDINDACETKYILINGECVAFINCCEHEFSIATESSAGANPLNPIRQYYAIKEAKLKSDFVVVIVHGGHEFCQYPSFRMIETYRFFVDSGADAVINHHQHCYSGYEYYKNRPIVYGLGNFCFDWEGRRNSNWNEGYLVELIFDKNDVGLICHPYYQCNELPKVSLIDGSSHVFETKLQDINEAIQNRNVLAERLESFYREKERAYAYAFEPYSGRIAIRLFLMGLLPTYFKGRKKRLIQDYHMCESHSDILDFILTH